MSRCFPYPPPGFGNKIQYNENDLSTKEKKKEKKKKKEKNSKKEGKEKKERNDKDESKSKQQKKKDRGRDTDTGVEEKNCFAVGGVQEAEADSGDTEYPNGLIVADSHSRGWNGFSREVRQNPRDSDLVPPPGAYGSSHYYSSGDKAGTNSLHPIPDRFVKESTKNVGGSDRSGGQHPTNPRNGFRNGDHLGPNRFHFSTKIGRGNAPEPERNDRRANSSGGESARSFGYCNGDGPVQNRRHMHESDMRRPPTSKPVSIIMDRSSSPATAQSSPPPRADGRAETGKAFVGQQNSVPKSGFMIPFNHRGRAEICRIPAESDAVKPAGGEARAELDGISVPGDSVGGGGKRKREGGKHMSKEEKARHREEKCRKREARAKRREIKAKKKEEKSKSMVVNEFEKRQSSAEQRQPSQPPLPMELDSPLFVQSLQREDLRLTTVVNVAGVPSKPEEEAKRSKHDHAPAADRHGGGIVEEDDSGSGSAGKATRSDADRHLRRFPPLPEIRPALPLAEDEDWLFNDSGGFRLSRPPKNRSPPRGVEVWAEALRIESADAFALPYVIPY